MTRKYLKLLHIVLCASLIYPQPIFSGQQLKKYDPRAQILENASKNNFDFSILFPIVPNKSDEKNTEIKPPVIDAKKILDLAKPKVNEKDPGPGGTGANKGPGGTPQSQLASGIPAQGGKAQGEKEPGDRGGGTKVNPITGNGRDPVPNIVNVDKWIPICFIFQIPPWTDDDIQKVVKLNVDNYGKCGIAMEPHVFKVPYMPPDSKKIEELSKKVCPLNSVFKVGGSAAQALTAYDGTADQMCVSEAKLPPQVPPEKKDQSTDPPLDKWSERVAGCSILGNGNAKDSSSKGMSTMDKKKFDAQARGSYGGRGIPGQPATSIVDRFQGASVSFHELGHSNGGPGEGKGGYLVNENESAQMGHKKGTPVGCGLEVLGEYDPDSPVNKQSAPEGSGNKDDCFFEKNPALGCASLRGGSNPNYDHRHVWDKNWEYDRSDMLWDFMAGKSFFESQPVNAPTNKIVGTHKQEPKMTNLPNTNARVLAESEPKPNNLTHSRKAKGGKLKPGSTGSVSLRKGEGRRERPNEIQDDAANDPPPTSEQGREPSSSRVRVEEGAGNASAANTNRFGGISSAGTDDGKSIAVGDPGATGGSNASGGTSETGGPSLSSPQESLASSISSEDSSNDPTKRVRKGNGERNTRAQTSSRNGEGRVRNPAGGRSSTNDITAVIIGPDGRKNIDDSFFSSETNANAPATDTTRRRNNGGVRKR